VRFIEQEDVNVLNFMPQKKVSFPRFSHVGLLFGFIFLLCFILSVGIVIRNHFIRSSIAQYVTMNNHKKLLFHQKASEMDRVNGHYVATLRKTVPQERHSFSKPMSVLASEYLDGVWLTDVRIDNDLNSILVKGNTYASSGLYDFLSKMNENPYFYGKRLNLVKIYDSERGQELQLMSQAKVKTLMGKLNKKSVVSKVVPVNVSHPVYFFEISNRPSKTPGVSVSRPRMGSKLILPKALLKR
jgi:hypothetical protein